MGHFWQRESRKGLDIDAQIGRASWRDAIALATPRDPRARDVRRTQVATFVKLVPMTILTQVVAAAVLVGTLRGSVPPIELGLWFGAAIVTCLLRAGRAVRLRVDPAYARAKPPTMAGITLVVAVLGALWVVPAVLWFGDADPQQQLFMSMLYAAMVSAGTVTMVPVPPAAMVYVALMLAACTAIAIQLDHWSHLALLAIYGAMLVWAIINNARYFIQHIRVRHELEERGEIIELLREFGAAGSGGLWELDAELRISAISAQLAEAMGRRPDEVIGLHAAELLDPEGKAIELSSGMRRLFDNIATGKPFRDLAVPALATRRWWSISGKPIARRDGEVIGWRGVGSDITDLRLGGDDAVRAARRDPLTGLANRLLVREQLEEVLLLRAAGDEVGCALLLVDLDRFKLVNDTLGHGVGDQLLVEVGRRIEQMVGQAGQVGRLGGDEFAVVWTGPRDRETLEIAATAIINALSQGFTIGAATVNIGATIGIAIGPDHGLREEQLLRSADLALYRVKESGRGSFAFFEQAMFEQAESLRLLENDVRGALQQGALKLAYQPIVDSISGKIVAREALLRWSHPERGDIPPDRFIPIIEDAGLIHQIGDWVIGEACRAAAGWDDKARVAVNVSAQQLSGNGLARTVVEALGDSGLDPARLEIEVTERVFLGDDVATLNSLEKLRQIGVRLVLDDFGKGYSSFGYLSRAQVAKIKIDQQFVRGAADGERESVAIIHAILALASGLGISTTAEGVESEDQAMAMRYLGVRELQGFHFGRPEIAEPSEERRRA